jgi:predicted dehydrogenase
MRSLKVGVVGTGFAASSHLDALRRVPRVEVVAIAGSSTEKATEAASRLRIQRAVGLREMAEDDSIDAVHNCTPNHLHAEVNETLLTAGKHVLSEKPLALDSAETARLCSVARSAGAVAGVCFNYRHYPLVRHVKSLLDSGRGGKPHFVHGSYLQDWLLHDTDWNWRLETDKAGSSRAVADIGSHWLDLVQHVCSDQVTEVCSDVFTLHTDRHRPVVSSETFQRSASSETERISIHTEDVASVLLRFASGTRGAMTVSQVSPGRKNRLFFEIDTSEAAFAWDQENPNSLWVGRRDGANEELVRDPTLLGPEAASLAHFPGGHQEGWPDGLRNLVIDFYDTVEAQLDGRARKGSFATFEEAHRVALAVEAIMASSASGSWVQVADERERVA